MYIHTPSKYLIKYLIVGQMHGLLKTYFKIFESSGPSAIWDTASLSLEPQPQKRTAGSAEFLPPWKRENKSTKNPFLSSSR